MRRLKAGTESRLVVFVLAAKLCATAMPCPASFTKGGILDAGPRSAALGGACAALAEDVLSARGSPANLAHVGRDYVQAAAGVASQSSLVTSSLSAGTSVEGIGVGALVGRAAFPGGSEHMLTLATGMPIAEMPWLSVGAAVKFLHTDLGTDRAAGFALDASGFARPPLPWEAWGLCLSVGIEDALGGLNWRTGLREDLPRLAHAGLAVLWAESAAAMVEVEVADSALGNESILGLGIEYGLRAFGLPTALRVGFRDGQEREAAIGGGTGLKLGSFLVDYALVGMTESQGYVHSLSVQWTYGRKLPAYLGKVFFSGDSRIKPEREVFRISSSYQTIRFRMTCSRDCARASSWTVVVMNDGGGAVWSMEGQGKPDPVIVWNCVTDQGEFAPSGDYTVQLLLRGPESLRYVAIPVRFRIERVPAQSSPITGSETDEFPSP